MSKKIIEDAVKQSFTAKVKIKPATKKKVAAATTRGIKQYDEVLRRLANK